MPRVKTARRSDGRYEVRYKNKHFYGTTIAQAQEKRREFIRAEQAGLLIKQQSVKQYAAAWLPVHKASVSDKCYADYAVQLNKMTDVIGHKQISAVKPSDAKKVFNEFLGLSESTIHRARMLYVAVFDSAIEDGYIHVNPFRSSSARPHKGTQGTHRVITEEQRTLIETVPHRFQAGAMVMLYAGLRRGEAIGLSDHDINMVSRTIRVSHAVRYNSNAPITSAPKTDAGTRDVPILDILVPFLTGRTGYIMQSAHGAQLTETAFRRGWDAYMHALSAAAGHPVSFRCHDLRHSFCTMLRDNGVDMKLAMKWMGHSDEKMILRIYDHVEQSRIEKAVQILEKSMSGRQYGRQNLDVSRETVDS